MEPLRKTGHVGGVFYSETDRCMVGQPCDHNRVASHNLQGHVRSEYGVLTDIQKWENNGKPL